MKYIGRSRIIFLFFFIFHFLFLSQVSAVDPDLPNNKFGIHFALSSIEDLRKTNEMVNSNGGDWGYVTLVIPENDRDKNKWQEVFDNMRELHLIPIIRLATVPQGAQWRRPTKEDAGSWVDFLDSLHWVVKDRFIILFNEPNHANEWGGGVDPENYAEVALEFSKQLKAKNPDYFIMLAGLDASAPSALPNYQDESIFLSEVINSITVEQFNNLFSGLASHSYPNPGFSGSPYDLGRRSIRGYEWELNLLNQLGVKDMPVFITETGWIRGNEDVISNNFKAAFSNIWSPDNRVVAVTPFVFDYQGEPFLNFSWKKYQDSDFYSQYYTVQSLPKVAGMPIQIEKGSVEFDLPNDLVAQSSYRFNVKLKNQGQAVWDRDFGYKIELKGENASKFEYFSSDIKKIKPFDETDMDLFLKTNGQLGKGETQVVLTKHGYIILDGGTWSFETFPLPSVNLKVGLFPKFKSSGNDFEMQIFNDKEEVVFKKKGVHISDGVGVINEVQNIALGRKYRIVILKPYYLPRQVITTFQKGANEIKFEKMLPLDFNKDGKLNYTDPLLLLKNPRLVSIIFP